MAEPRPDQIPPPEAAETEPQVLGAIGPNGIESGDAQETPEAQVEAAETALTPEEQAIRQEEQAKIAKMLKEVDQSFEQGVCEPRALAEAIGDLKSQAADARELALSLEGYFSVKQEQDLFQDLDPKQLAESIAAVEGKIEEIMAQVDREFRDLDPDLRKETGDSIREALFSIVINGHLTGAKLLGFLGNVKVQKAPGNEFQEHAMKSENAAAYYKFDESGTTIYLYENFINGSREAKTRHPSHELGHILCERNRIWEEAVYQRFLVLSEYPTDDGIQEMADADAEELAEVLKIIQRPEDQNLSIWSRYIQSRIQALLPENLAKIPEENRGAEKRQVARELAAELTGYFLSDGKSEMSYLAKRIGACDGETSEVIIKYLMERSGCQTQEEFLKKYQISDPSQALEQLAAHDEFAPLLKLNKLAFGKMTKVFANNGSAIEEVSDGDEDVEFADELPESIILADDYDYLSEGPRDETQEAPKAPSENPLQKLFEFLTGKKAQKSPGSPKPVGMPKQAGVMQEAA